jgi:hypothetical protein
MSTRSILVVTLICLMAGCSRGKSFQPTEETLIGQWKQVPKNITEEELKGWISSRWEFKTRPHL